MIRCVDAIDKEQQYLKSKFEGREDLIDIEARLNLYTNKRLLIIKYCCGFNYCSKRDYQINQGRMSTLL